MANITNFLNKIKTAVHGKDVRGAIHDAIKQVYDDASVEHDNANMEVKMARGTHDTLNDRLDKTDEIQAQTNAQLSEVANKGTTIEVLERVTKEEIDRQIEDGTLATLTIENNGVPLQKLDLTNIGNTVFDKFTITVTKYDTTTEKEAYALYMYHNTSISDETTDLTCSCTVYTTRTAMIKFSAKLFYNDDSTLTNLTGQSSTSTIVLNLKKGFNTFKTTFKGISLNKNYYRFMPWFRFTKIDGEDEINVYLTDVVFNEKIGFNLIDKMGQSSNISLSENELLQEQPVTLSKMSKVINDSSDFITDIVKSYNDEEYLNFYAPNILKANGGVGHTTITLNLSAREKLAPYDFKIPSGTKIKYTIEFTQNSGQMTSVGFQLHQSDNPNNSNSNISHQVFDRYLLNGQKKYTWEHTFSSDSTYTIQENLHIKLYFDCVYETGVDFTGTLIYSDIEFVLPNGESIFEPISIHNVNVTGEKAYMRYDDSKPIMYEFLTKETTKLREEMDDYVESLKSEIANTKRVPSRWTDKSYSSVGDSITWQHEQTIYTDDNSPLKGYQYYVIERLGVSSFENNAVAGMTMAQYDGWSNTFMTRYKNINWSNYDLITIALGTNDFGNGGGCDIGDINSTDTSTYCGAYNTVLQHIFKTNPKIRVVLMTPFQRASGLDTNSKGHTLIDYVNAVIELGEKWSCPVFDCYRNSGWNQSTFDVYTVDRLHGSAEGFEFVGKPLGEFLAIN